MKCLEQCSHYLHPHGVYAGEWRDEQGPIFKRLFCISQSTMVVLLAEAIAGIDPNNYEQSSTEVARLMAARWGDQEALPSWLAIQNKDFVLFRYDFLGNVFGIYKHDYKIWLIQAKAERVSANYRALNNPRLKLALEGKFASC